MSCFYFYVFIYIPKKKIHLFSGGFFVVNSQVMMAATLRAFWGLLLCSCQLEGHLSFYGSDL